MERILSTHWISDFFTATGRLVSFGRYKADRDLETNLGIITYTGAFMVAALVYFLSV